MIIQSINPYTQKVVQSFELHQSSDIQKIVAQSAKSFKDWKNKTIAQRTEFLALIAQKLREKKQDLALLIATEMGKPLQEAKAEIEKCAITCEYYQNNAANFLKNIPIATEATQSYVIFEPLGAVLGIMPWNFPFWQVFRFAIPCLVAGNVILLKHAPNVWACASAIENIFREVALEGVFQNLFVEISQIESIVSQPIVQAITFTGSTLAGAKVASLAGKYSKKTVLELGGSDAFIVLADANLEKASQIAVESRMRNAGQSCIAAKRFLVEKNIYDDFVELFKTKIAQLKAGDPIDENTQIGVMARPDLAQKAAEQLAQSMALGARLVMGGTRNENFFAPTLLADVSPQMPVFQEEVFAPIAPIMSVENIEEAIKITNNIPYGLGASIWTNDFEKLTYWIPQIETGNVFVNSLVKSDPRMPFGGIKNSGYGRELGFFGLQEFTNIKSVWIEN